MTEETQTEQVEKTDAELAAEIAAEARAAADEAEDQLEEAREVEEQLTVEEAQAVYDEADKALNSKIKAAKKAEQAVEAARVTHRDAKMALEAVNPKPSTMDNIQRHLKKQAEKRAKGHVNAIDVAGKGGPSPFQL